MVVMPRAEEGRYGELVFHVDTSVWEAENGREVDGGDSCTTV